jgi:hypothetical protein
MAVPAEIGGKNLAQIHAPSQIRCRLLTHRFKSTKIRGLATAAMRAAVATLSGQTSSTVTPLGNGQCMIQTAWPIRRHQPTMNKERRLGR